LLRYVEGHINAVRQREISLRGYQIPAIENLGILQDAYDCIDLSDNSILVLANFPEMKRLITLLLHNNKIKEISKGLGRLAPNLENLMMANNRIDRLSQLDGLAEFGHLLRLNLRDNPVCKRDGYRLYVIARCPSLKHLDFEKIKASERIEAEKVWGKKLKARSSKKGADGKAKSKGSGQRKGGQMGAEEVVDEEKGSALHAEDVEMNGGHEITNGADSKLTATQSQVIQRAIAAAKTNEECDKLAKILESGRIPEGDWNKLTAQQ